MKPSLNRTTIFKFIVHGIELHTVFEERENKQKNATFLIKKEAQGGTIAHLSTISTFVLSQIS